MSVGGNIIEIIDCSNDNRIWVNTKDKSDTCAVWVERDKKSKIISEGDSLWWQGGNCYWTPKGSKRDRQGINFDIVLKKIGYSGISKRRALAVKNGIDLD